jgi:ferredoxin/formate-dependent nitrite reductase membrane component NrfD
MYKRDDGIVDFDKSICIGCKACIAACPYDAIFINPEDHSAEKCNFCAHRIDVGLEPACAVVCPVEAILVGDLDDPSSKVSGIVNRDAVSVRRPEKETLPKLFYKGAHQVTLDPIAAERPSGDTFMWSEMTGGSHVVNSGHPDGWSNSSAAALLSYDVPHSAPWDWRVSLYTWTKSIAAGSYLVALLLILIGELSWSSDLFKWVAPIMAAAFLALTGAVLIWDLEHPKRFYMIFTRPHWRSWLVRGAVIIGGFGAALAVHFLSAAIGSVALRKAVAVAGLPLAIMTAVYTAYLFAQSKARDLWQSPLLPPHIFVQAVLAGSAAVLPFAPDAAIDALEWTLAASAAVHLLLIAGEVTLAHPTAHAHLAVAEMTRGAFREFFWVGAALVMVAVAAPAIGIWAAPAALLGLLSYEHAYVQSAQAVPLA